VSVYTCQFKWVGIRCIVDRIGANMHASVLIGVAKSVCDWGPSRKIRWVGAWTHCSSLAPCFL
jgi:hypothetical protein